MLKVGQIRRRQVLLTIDPEIVLQLKVAAKRARMPVSALVEEGARRMLGLLAVKQWSAIPPASILPPMGASSQVEDLFGRRV